MNRIERILFNARGTLADPDKSRWSDARLLSLLDEAQKDICRTAKVLRDTTSISIYDDKAIYTVDDAILLDRVLYNNKRLDFIDHSKLDYKKVTWEKDKGSPTAIVYDKLQRGALKLYPIPMDTDSTRDFTFISGVNLEEIDFPVDSLYGIATGTEPNSAYSIESLYGIDTGITFIAYNADKSKIVAVFNTEADTPYGMITDVVTKLQFSARDNTASGTIVDVDNFILSSDYGLVDNFEPFEAIDIEEQSLFGITSDIVTARSYLDVYYIKQPKDINNTNDELEVDSIFDKALKYFITGMALRDDMDAQNRLVGNEELNFYGSELMKAVNEDNKDYARNDNKQYSTNYNGGF